MELTKTLRLGLPCLVAFGFAAFGQTPAASPPSVAVAAIAELSDPAKLAALTAKRAANGRVLKIMVYLEEARRAGMIPSKTVDEAQKITGDTGAHAALVKDMLLYNHEQATRWGLFTPENMEKMRGGHAPSTSAGTKAKDPVEVDHLLPVDELPQLGNELANLQLLTRNSNRRKSDAIKQRALGVGRKMVEAHMITEADLEKVRRMR